MFLYYTKKKIEFQICRCTNNQHALRVHNLILVFLLTALCCVTYTPYFSTHMWVIVFRAEFVQIQQ